MTPTILACDLGKFNSVLCWYEPATKQTAFRTVRTESAELRRELTREPVSQVVFEACSQAGWVHDLCEELKLAALVASTTGTAWQWKRVKRKTDRDDALKLARLAAVGEIDGVPVPPRANPSAFLDAVQPFRDGLEWPDRRNGEVSGKSPPRGHLRLREESWVPIPEK
ncbi:MAG TPA: hypothetical protein VGJ05_20950, partial [Fimbriiglobus sp.]